MIERYFKSGVRFLWKKPNDLIGPLDGDIVPSRNPPTDLVNDGLDGHAEVVDKLLLTVESFTVLGQKKGDLVPYDWLDYGPGRTTFVRAGANDVLSGYMSGCPIVRGTYNGVMSVFHVGTIDSMPAVNKKIKQTLAPELPADATWFNPAGAWGPEEVKAKTAPLGTNANTNVFALVTATGDFYSLLMVNVRDAVMVDPSTFGTVTLKRSPLSFLKKKQQPQGPIVSMQPNNARGQTFWCVGGIKKVPAVSRAKLMASFLT